MSKTSFFQKSQLSKLSRYVGVVLILALLLGLTLSIQTAQASGPVTTVYDALPNPVPPNVASLGFQATSTSEFGDYIHLAGTDRLLSTVTVTMSDWALYSDYSSDIRYSDDAVNWTHPITLNIYSVVPGSPNTVGVLLATKTQTVTIPWRPAADPTCPGGTAWRASNNQCYNGFAFNVTFDLSSLNVTLPNDIIVGVAYSTQSYGASPIGVNGPYNSLNVGIATGQVANVGSDDNSDKTFWDTIYPGYTAGFKEDTGWSPNGTVNIQVTTKLDCTGTSDCYVDAVNGNDANGGASISDAKKTIQAAIDAVAAGGRVHVLPGNYSETATNRLVLGVNGPYQFGLFISQDKAGISIIGVDGSDTPITDYNSLQAHVTTNATNNFGASGIFVEGDNVRIAGLDILDNVSGNNKTIEVIGDNFTLEHSHINVSDGGSVYFNDWQFDTVNTISHIQSYTINHNWFDLSASLDLTSGAGYSGAVSGRKITNNKFVNENSWPSISFNGSNTGVPWFVYSVGGAVITGNDFTNTFNEVDDTSAHIRARGTYDNTQFDWTSYWQNNTYNKAAVTLIGAFPNVRTYSYPNSYGTFNDVRRIGVTIQGEVDHAATGDTVLVNQGAYVEQVVISKTIDLTGEDGALLTFIQAPATLPIASDPASTIIDVKGTGVQVEISGFTVQGPGPISCGGIESGIFVRDAAYANIHDNRILDIRDNEPGPTAPFSGCQNGVGITVGSASLTVTGTADIKDNLIQGYQKNGIVVSHLGSSASVVNNTVSGFGAQTEIAQNGIQISDGAVGTITGNTVNNHLCDHATCGADPITGVQSAGILLYDPGVGTVVSANTISNNDMGLYNYVDAGGAPTINGNLFIGNRYTGIFLDQGNAIVSNNDFSGTSNIGIAVVSFDAASWGTSANSSGTLTNNFIRDAVTGIKLLDEATTDAFIPTITANLNSINGNATAGFNNTTATSADAEKNWWGSDTGPAGSGPGTGDTVSANVDFTPWLCDGTDTQPAVIGFQPNPAMSPCVVPTGTITITKLSNAAGTFNFSGPSGNFSLSSGGSTTFNNVPVGAYVVTESDSAPAFSLTGLVCNDANGTTNLGTRTANIQLEAGETVTCTFTNTKATPKIALGKQEPVISIGGSALTYTYKATNPGNVPLSNVTVTDDKCSPVTYVSGDSNTNNLLEPGEAWMFTCSYTPSFTSSKLTNKATVTGTFGSAAYTANDSATLYPFTLKKKLYLYWGENPKNRVPYSQLDNTPFTIQVYKNNVLVSTITISQNTPAKLWLSAGTYTFKEIAVPSGYLPVVSSFTYKTSDGHGSHHSHHDYGRHEDDDEDDDGKNLTEWIYPNVIRYNLAIDKTGPATARKGTTITYTYTVTNSGPASVRPKVTDDKCSNVTYVSGDTDSDGRVDPGETWNFKCTYKVTANAGSKITNKATVSDADQPKNWDIGGDINSTNNKDTWTLTVIK